MDIAGFNNCLYYALTKDGWEDVGDFNQNNVIAIMSTGWTAWAESFNLLRARLWEDHGIPSRMGATFRLAEHGPMKSYDDFGAQLAESARRTIKEYPDRKVILVGQSAGGVAALAAYLCLGDPKQERGTESELQKRIIAIFPLGAPFYGVRTPLLNKLNPLFKSETKRVLENSDVVKKIVAIHAKYDEMVPMWHSRLEGAKHKYIDTGFDTFGDKLFALFFPLPAFCLSLVPVRHIALAVSPQVPKIINKYTLRMLKN